MRTTLNGIFFKKAVSKAERKRREKERREDRPAESKPYKGSDGYWRIWINDGRGGYDQLLPRDEQDRLDWDGGR